jgi:c-di-AMP phosphodiesterase-like protein
MITTIIAYFLVLILVPILGAISGLVVAPLFFLNKITGKLFPLFLSGVINGFVSIWLGLKILGLFDKKAGLVMILIISAFFVYHYTKDSSAKIKTENSFAKDLVKESSNQNITILIGNLIGLIISCLIFIY